MPTVDDFEDTDFSEWTITDGTIERNGTSTSGSFSARDDGGFPGGRMYSEPGDGLSNYPGPGSDITLYMRNEANIGLSILWSFYFGWDETNENGYEVQLNASGLDLLRIDNGSSTLLADDNNNAHSRDTWFEVSIQWDTDGSITVETLDGGSTHAGPISATDDTYSNSGIVCEGISDDYYFWDGISYEALPQTFTQTFEEEMKVGMEK